MPIKPLLMLFISAVGTLSVPVAASSAAQFSGHAPAPVVQLAQAAPASEQWRSPFTKRLLSGPFLDWFHSHCDVDLLGQPVSELQWDSAGVLIQSFERGTLEMRDGNVKLRAVVDQYLPDNDPPVPAEGADNENYQYFAADAGGFGHAVRNQLHVGDQTFDVGFKAFFDRCGGVDVLGRPKEEPKVRDGHWTQRFQAGLLQYWREYDTEAVNASGMPMRNWKVQPALTNYVQGLSTRPAAQIPLATDLMAVTVFFMSQDGTQFQPQARLLPYSDHVALAILTEVIIGPQGGGLHATVHPATQIHRLDIVNGVAKLDLSAHFLISENHAWAANSITLAMTQVAGVRGVQINVEEKPLGHYWGADYSKVFTR